MLMLQGYSGAAWLLLPYAASTGQQPSHVDIASPVHHFLHAHLLDRHCPI